jgi:superfamily I DNA/RNA helicase
VIDEAIANVGSLVDPAFLKDEWRLIVDAWDVHDRETYREIPRLGRKVRMATGRRDEVWEVFEEVRSSLMLRGATTEAALMHALANGLSDRPFTHVVIDEAQDISVPELRLVAAMAGERINGVFFAGDIGQRIFRSAFPWKAAGVDIQGRSRSLKVNYRTSHQIRSKCDLLLPPRLLEADGGEDKRTGITSVFHGPQPEIHSFGSASEEARAAGAWLARIAAEGVSTSMMSVLVRSQHELERARSVIEHAGLTGLTPTLMHDAKGREFRAVAVLACDANVLPSEERLLAATDERALGEIYDTERHLLYVAATRARDFLWISGREPLSEFVEDLVA